jgi:ubiquinone/menaquinone biosynthesis C-methylase UbiE
MSSGNWQVSYEAAVLYEKYVHPLMVPWVETLVETATIREGQRVLDVACGTGFVARLAAAHVGLAGQVAGVDLNKGMLAVARQISSSDTALPIEWHEGDVTDLPFDDASFDAVLCQQGMQFFPDIQGAANELNRVMVPDGRLVFTIWSPIEENPYLDALAHALEQHLSEQAANGLRGAFAKSYSVDFEPALRNAGFKQIEVDAPRLAFHLPPLEEQLPGHMASLPMADAISALPDEAKVSILNDVRFALKEFANQTGLSIPSRSEVVSAVK